jgi:hypothetical protein
MPRLKIPRTLLAAACVLAAPLAAAADWRFNPQVEVGAMTDSNLRLSETGGDISVAGGFTAARLEFQGVTPLASFSFTPRVEATWFPDDKDQDYVNGGAGIAWLRRSQKVSSRFQADFDRSVSITGNRAGVPGEGGDLGDPLDDGDSGVLDHNRIETLRLREALRLQMTERNALELGLGFTDREFEEQTINDEVSYTAWTGDIAWRTQVDERSSLALRGRALLFDPELLPVKTRALGIEGEWAYQVTERLDAYARAGVTRTSYNAEVEPDPDSDTSVIGGVGGSWQLRVSRVLLDLTRSIDPNSSGYSVERSQLRFRLDRDFSPRVRGSVAARLISDEGPDGFNDRRYVVASVGAEWRFTRVWSLIGRFDHTRQNYDLTPGSATSNALRLSVSYQPRRSAEPNGSPLD